jgi:hypothetical protein
LCFGFYATFVLDLKRGICVEEMRLLLTHVNVALQVSTSSFPFTVEMSLQREGDARVPQFIDVGSSSCSTVTSCDRFGGATVYRQYASSRSDNRRRKGIFSSCIPRRWRRWAACRNSRAHNEENEIAKLEGVCGTYNSTDGDKAAPLTASTASTAESSLSSILSSERTAVLMIGAMTAVVWTAYFYSK